MNLSKSTPNHVGIILDGNRRFARRLMLKPWKGHEWGAKKIEKLFDWAHELDVKELTLYAFSIQNFNRPKEEFDYLMNIFRKELKRILTDKRLEERDVRVNFIGRLWMLDKDIQESIQKIMDKTKSKKSYTVNFAIAYGGREEVVDATRKIAEQVKSGTLDIDKINDESFTENLWLSSSPDLIIRTGGERRTSNFLNFQAAYSEWIFLDKAWPEFEKEDLVSCVEEFSQRKRRFGK